MAFNLTGAAGGATAALADLIKQRFEESQAEQAAQQQQFQDALAVRKLQDDEAQSGVASQQRALAAMRQAQEDNTKRIDTEFSALPDNTPLTAQQVADAQASGRAPLLALSPDAIANMKASLITDANGVAQGVTADQQADNALQVKLAANATPFAYRGNANTVNAQNTLKTRYGALQKAYPNPTPEQQQIIAGGIAAGEAPDKIAEALQKPDKAVTAGSFEDFLSRTANTKGVAVSSLSPADILTAKAKYDAAGKDTAEDNAAVDLSPAGLDVAARRYNQDGTLPPMGMGKAGAAARTKIINRAAELDPNAAIAANKANLTADTASLKGLQTQADAVSAFETTAFKNADVFISAADKVADSGSPLLNKPLRELAGSVDGSPEQQAYATARRTVVPEFAKILNNPSMSAQLSDSARHEMEDVLSGNATLAQTKAAINILKQDAENRRTALNDQITDVQGRIKSFGGSSLSTTGNTASSSSTSKRFVYNPKTGQLEPSGGQ